MSGATRWPAIPRLAHGTKTREIAPVGLGPKSSRDLRIENSASTVRVHIASKRKTKDSRGLYDSFFPFSVLKKPAAKILGSIAIQQQVCEQLYLPAALLLHPFFFFAIRLAQQQTVTRLKQAANQSGVCQRPSTSWWGMAACSHIHVPIVGQGQGLLRRRRCLSAFGWFTGGKKNRDERRERLTGYLTWRHTAARLWFQSLQRIPLSDSGCTRRRQNIAGNITHSWQEEGEIKQMVFKLLSPTMCAT